MSKYAESECWIKEYGLEKCQMMDAYYENERERKDKLLEEMMSYENRKQLADLLNEKTGLKLGYEI